ncbi:AIPR family protein [Aeromonas media]|uniref:AIPR family protein n=1 Tax=Aeromonas media TaxID=651 RepID=UPI0024C12565|nr:AIPR family protein [Aeromonas media]MDM5077388.1 AIPR family protein [Aeromonas media]
MAKNDALLLDGIIDDRIEHNVPSNRRDEAFEYLAFEQILKNYDLSGEEITYGSIDGRNDGGIDGFFIFVNGHLLKDVESFLWPKSGALLEIWVITCKHHDTFKQAPLDNIVASLSELFDLSIAVEHFKGDYSVEVIKLRENLKFAYRKLSPKLSGFNIQYVYASRGDTTQIGDSIISRSDQLTNITKEFFGACKVEFQFLGSTELVNLHRKTPNFSLELPFTEVLSSGERYVLLANLADYYGFVSDEGSLRRYLFDSNVRDFMGLNRVNEDIKNTLEDDESPDFWCLNNGVTILATSASLVGDCIKLEDIQIVNGLQTTESIFRYFEAGGKDKKNRSVLIKVIVSQNDDVRDSIIRATNNQTDVEMASLHATDKIQRDIEDIFERSDYFYERRKNFHNNLGNPLAKVVTPLYIASGYVSLVLKSPQKASNLRSRFMRSDEAYNTVFSEKIPLSVYPVIAAVLKITDLVLEDFRPKRGSGGERFLKRWRQVVSFITVSRLLGSFDFSVVDLSKLDIEKYTYEEVKETWDFICLRRPEDIISKNIKNKHYYVALCQEAAEEFSISDISRVEKANNFNTYLPAVADSHKPDNVIVDLELVQKIDDLLPPQPWKPGVHKKITKALGCSNKEYFQAVQILIEDGIRNKQVDGVVYDAEGNVITFDPERVDPDTLELLDT